MHDSGIADSCPNCQGEPVEPQTTNADAVCVIAHYECLLCGNAWSCSWSTQMLRLNAQDGAA